MQNNKLSANGVQGHLLYTGGPNRYVFRVYTDAGKFTDYDLLHSDLCVTITDEDATLYSNNGGNRLDHNPTTLGMNELIKDDVNHILGKLFFQDHELMEVWWHTANKHFEFNTPTFIFQKDADGRQRVYDYVQKCFLGQ